MIPAALLLCAAAEMHHARPMCKTRDSAEIADAIDAATDDDRLRAVMSIYAFHESWLRVGVWGDSGRSYGAWQMRADLARKMSVREQARAWLAWVAASSLASVDSSASRAAQRLTEAAAVLERSAQLRATWPSSRDNFHR